MAGVLWGRLALGVIPIVQGQPWNDTFCQFLWFSAKKTQAELQFPLCPGPPSTQLDSWVPLVSPKLKVVWSLVEHTIGGVFNYLSAFVIFPSLPVWLLLQSALYFPTCFLHNHGSTEKKKREDCKYSHFNLSLTSTFYAACQKSIAYIDSKRWIVL